jgi:hypothetical protein
MNQERRVTTISDRVKYALKSVSNLHFQGDRPNIFLFATPRGGSTWVMEILASQAGMKYYDEPFNIRRDNVAFAGWFRTWESLMPGTGDPDRVIAFLNGLASGKHRHMNPPPFRPHHRLITNRIVFKIHVVKYLIGRIARECGGQVVYLLRHPVPTTQSRAVFPRLELFLASPYFADLIGDGQRLRDIRRLGAGGTKLEKGVVSWCYENLIPLTRPDFDGLVVAYEELVLNPERACDLFLERLHFDDREKMLRAFHAPATNISMSSADRLAEMVKPESRDRAISLVSKWREKLTVGDRRSVNEIMGLFGLDVYTADCALPHPRYLHFDDTAAVLGCKHGVGSRNE